MKRYHITCIFVTDSEVLQKINADFHMKCLSFLTDFNQNWKVIQIFIKSPIFKKKSG